MNYLFDLCGWYVGESDAVTDRSTPVAPTDFTIHYTEGAPRSNWTGYAWLMLPYTSPPIVEPVVEVPQVVTMRQARLSLLNAGLLDDVNTIMMSSSQAIQIDWEYATEVQRQSPLVLSMADTLGLTSAQVDNLFIDAAAL